MDDLDQMYRECFIKQEKLSKEFLDFASTIEDDFIDKFVGKWFKKTDVGFSIETSTATISIFGSLFKADNDVFCKVAVRSYPYTGKDKDAVAKVLLYILEDELLRLSEFADSGIQLALFYQRDSLSVDELTVYHKHLPRAVVEIRSYTYTNTRHAFIELRSRVLKKIKFVLSEESIKTLRRMLSVV